MAATVTPGLEARPLARIRTRRARLAVPLGILGVLALVAVFADIVATHPPMQTALGDRLLPPGRDGHLLGTDPLGRDIFSRIVHGTRISLAVAAVSALVGGTLGSLLGMVAGYFRGSVDAVIMRLADISLGFPLLIVAVLVAALYGPSFTNVIVILVLGMWARFARIARGGALALRDREFVVAARIAGTPTWRILARHIAPHLTDSLLIMLSLQAAWAVLLEAGLSFFGVGIPPPAPSWGQMISDGRGFVLSAWWVAAFPGIAIAMLVLALNLTGDALRDEGGPARQRGG